MAESWTELKFGHPTFNCNICSSFAQGTSQLCFNHSQEPCEWVHADLAVLWVCSSGSHLLTAVDGRSVSGSRDATNSKRNTPAVSKWEPLEQTLSVEPEQILHLKVGCSNFGPVQGLAIYPTYQTITLQIFQNLIISISTSVNKY